LNNRGVIDTNFKLYGLQLRCGFIPGDAVSKARVDDGEADLWPSKQHLIFDFFDRKELLFEKPLICSSEVGVLNMKWSYYIMIKTSIR